MIWKLSSGGRMVSSIELGCSREQMLPRSGKRFRVLAQRYAGLLTHAHGCMSASDAQRSKNRPRPDSW
jgi:hypothetical protein